VGPRWLADRALHAADGDGPTARARSATSPASTSTRAQNVPTHTVGTKAGTPLVNGGAQGVAYTSVLNTESVPGISDADHLGWTASSAILKQGDTFTIAGVFAVNPVTKATLPYLQQFVVQADTSSDGAGRDALDCSGDHHVGCEADRLGGSGQLGRDHRPRHCLDRLRPEHGVQQERLRPGRAPDGEAAGRGQVARESYKGLSVRVIPYYTGSTDTSNWRLDVLYGVKTIDPRLRRACRAPKPERERRVSARLSFLCLRPARLRLGLRRLLRLGLDALFHVVRMVAARRLAEPSLGQLLAFLEIEHLRRAVGAIAHRRIGFLFGHFPILRCA
jgi:hypothetical protein